MPEPREQRHRISPHMKSRARSLRREMTTPEAMLWNVLKRKQLGGLKFRKQAPIGPYVVDFYCAECELVVEVDGESHVGTGDEDDKRTRDLEAMGLFVFRVTNDDVVQHLEAVADGILRAADQRRSKVQSTVN